MNTQNIGVIAVAFLLVFLFGLGAYSVKGNTGNSKQMTNIMEIPTEEFALVDSLPREDKVDIDDFRIILDQEGNVQSVEHQPKSVEKKIVIKDRKGKVKKEVEVKKMTDMDQEVEYETSTTTIENEDGTTETIPQVVIKKPRQKEARKITLIQEIDGKEYHIELSNPSGKLYADHMVYTPSQEVEVEAHRRHHAPPYFLHDTLPSSEEWEEFERNMHEYSRQMAEWGQEYARKMQEHMINQDSLQKMVHKMQDHMSDDEWTEEEKEEFERKMEAYGERMEAWGERFETAMEKWAEQYGAEMEKLGEEMEQKMEQMDMPLPPPPPPPPLPEHPETPPPPPVPDKG